MNTDRLRREFPWMRLPGDAFLPRRQFGWLTLGVVAFTVYGSFVPFKLRAHPTEHPLASFRWAVEQRSNVQSRSDFLANFALGVPLGFCALAWRLLDRNPSRLAVAGTAAAVWPFCVALAVGVEFGQLYFEGRTTSGSDILAQSAGSAAGMLAFVLAGPAAIGRVRRHFDRDQYRTPAVALLTGYVALLALNQLLPLDLTASPAEWYRKFRDGRVTLVPFSDFAPRGQPAWRKVQAWLEVAALYLPVGLLLGVARPRMPVARVLALGLLLAGGLEAGQILVATRSPSATDVALGAAAVLLGALLARNMGTGRGLDVEAALILAQAWLLWLAVAAWLPFEFDGRIGGDRLRTLTWLPFETALEKNYLSGLEEIITKTLVFLPFGVVTAAYGPPGAKGRVAAGVALAAGVGLLLEAGQLYLPDRVAAPMDVLYAAAGGCLGAAATRKLRPEPAADAPPAALRADELANLGVN